MAGRFALSEEADGVWLLKERVMYCSLLWCPPWIGLISTTLTCTDTRTHTQIIPPKDILADKKRMSGDRAHLVCVFMCSLMHVCVPVVDYSHEYVMEIL